ncbi:methionine aminopeptidase [Roseivirga spongicola]|uniref:Methionine aminopeptidase n=1 Tax=Roseivirga spongicola TaxID=333140 RepID=A0A150X972_9BACT|nr:type I methionyl aminopeptidase [Roseivirga spongicola]KYG75287.1 methionine aminopeptidase [Roseivirga spongicola]
MIFYKTEEEIQKIRESAEILAKAHGEVAKLIKPGIKTKDLDKVAEEFIADHGATGSFKGYNGFPATLCISVNEVVVHGFPSDYELKDGDIISVDCGVFYQGFHSDSAYTYPVGDTSPEILSLLKTTKESLYVGIEEAKFGNRIGDLAFAIQKYVEDRGYTVVRELVGHGLGRSLHEGPEVPNYGKRGRGPKLNEGLVIAIEPMINLGTRNIVQESDGWTIRTRDRKPSAHFEHTIAIFKDRTEILTSHKYIEEVVKF